MAIKSALALGKINEPFSHSIWEPDSDIRTGVWSISLQKILIKFEEEAKKEFSICTKTNLVEQNERDKQGNILIIKTCLGLFSCKGKVGEEIVFQNSNAQFFNINRPEDEIFVIPENPLTKKPFPKEKEKKPHIIGCYFVYKRIQ